MLEDGSKKNEWFLLLIGISCLAAVVISFYAFFFNKDYEFIVEVTCDPSKEVCFQRDCSDPDNCPPNGLSDFKRYSLSASDFEKCENEDCTSACEQETIKCDPVKCAEDLTVGESCSTFN